MTDLVLLRTGSYHDSARLMQVGRELSSLPGISEAVAMMGTPTNRELLRAAGFSGRALDEATPLDMVVALRGASADAFAATQEALDALLSGKAAAAGTTLAGEVRPGAFFVALIS